MELPIYMDHHATTPVDPKVLEAMLPYFGIRFGNAASKQHSFGWMAEEAVEASRVHIANLIHADPTEIVFTSGATESNNLALRGAAYRYQDKGKHILTQPTEHPCVLECLEALEGEGFEVQKLPVNTEGQLEVSTLEAAIRPDTILVSVMMANNEVGTLFPVHEIAQVCAHHGVLFHTDAAQAAAWIPIDVKSGVSLMSLSAHKMYGPKGVGALYVRRRDPRVSLRPLLYGGGHEKGLRPGSLNVPAIVGFGEAAQMAQASYESDAIRVAKLRDRVEVRLSKDLGLKINGPQAEQRLPNNLNMMLKVDAEHVIANTRHLAFSSGAACASDTLGPSHVLLAMGFTEEEAKRSIRLGFGRFTTTEEVEFVLEYLSEQILALS